jgi:hypothetical protein
MHLDRRQLALPALALGLLSIVPAFAGADEDEITKKVEAFRAAQAAGNADGIAPLCAEELSYSHSSGSIDDKAKLLNGVKTANYKWTTLEYKNPTVKVVGPAAIVRFNFVGEQEFTDGKKTPQNLAILMNWQKQGNEWWGRPRPLIFRGMDSRLFDPSNRWDITAELILLLFRGREGRFAPPASQYPICALGRRSSLPSRSWLP